MSSKIPACHTVEEKNPQEHNFQYASGIMWCSKCGETYQLVLPQGDLRDALLMHLPVLEQVDVKKL